MFALIIFLSCLFGVVAIGVMAAYSDFKGMIIPNMHSVIIFAVFVVCYLVLWALGQDAVFSPILSHVLGFVLVFVASFALFAFKIWGAGDQKLLSAFSIWMGFAAIPSFLVYTSLFGGVLGIAALLIRKFKPFKSPEKDSWLDQVQNGAGKVPYGIAIVLGALASFAKIGYFNVDSFSLFLG